MLDKSFASQEIIISLDNVLSNTSYQRKRKLYLLNERKHSTGVTRGSNIQFPQD